MGTDSGMDLGMVSGDVPIRNWTIGQAYDLAANLGGPALAEQYLVGKRACLHCPIACKRVVEVRDSPFQLEPTAGPEYETCAAFGTLIMNSNLAAVAKANDLCNRYGMDTISCGAAIAFAMECFANQLIFQGDADGRTLAWGDMQAVLGLLDDIAHRRGFGDVLADGTRKAAKRIGKGAERFAIETKGLELPMHDPRAHHGIGLAYSFSNRGGCHLQHIVYPVRCKSSTRRRSG